MPDPSDPDTEEVWTIERVEVAGPTGPFELRATIQRYVDGALAQTTERTLIRRVQDVLFTLEYAVGPRLERATIDLTVQPDDVQADTVGGDLEAPALRMVTSVAPRRLE
ncbi:MAG: hypothetical protein H6811_05420 [Phycisphaeraceae bacterium]|nr:hypothetical protein [Phycisphaeraceae bacterium]